MVHLVKEAAAGFLLAAEVEYLGKALGSPARPFVAILGGAKVSDKLEVIVNLLGRVDALLIGGAMAYTFFKAQGIAVGKSLVEDDLVATAKDLIARATAKNVKLELPVDHVVAPALKADAPAETLAVGDAAIGDRMGLDIGPKTVAKYAGVIRTAKTVVWNGPMGVFEIDAFANGTIDVARAVAGVHGTTIIGGGDSVAAVTRAGVADKMTHISTGGGASLEFLGGRELPGVKVLERAGLTSTFDFAQVAPSVVEGRTSNFELMRTPLLAANWKMYKTLHDATAFVREFSALVKTLTKVDIVVAPPFTALAAVAEIARNTRVGVASQDVYFEREGAYTGEVSATMIKAAGATHGIDGHSERRRLF